MTATAPVVEIPTDRRSAVRAHLARCATAGRKPRATSRPCPATPSSWCSQRCSRSCSWCCSCTCSAGRSRCPATASYKQFVIPGIFAQTVLFGSIYTGLGIAEDLSKGFIDRLRSLPMYPSAYLLGRTMSDVVRNALSFAVMLGVAFIIGFRFEGSLARRRRRDAAAVPVRLRVQLDPGLHRPRRRIGGSGQLDRVPLDVRRDVHLVGLRRTGEHARAGCSRSPSTTRSRSSPTRAARSTTAATRAPTRGSRSHGRSGSRSCSPRCR